jgi:hypothetical protein
MGHAVGDVTGLYQTRELLSWLAEDAKRLQNLAGKVVPAAKFPDICPDTVVPGVASKRCSSLHFNTLAPLAQLAEQVTLNH